MKGHTSFKFLAGALAVSVAAGAATGSVSLQQAQRAADHDVIVILRDQLENAPPDRESMDERSRAASTAQRPVVDMLQQMRQRSVHSFSLINAFATKISDAESSQLSAHPAVLAVVPDRTIRAPRIAREVGSAAIRAALPVAAAGATSSPLCNTLEPEALQLTHTAYADASTPQAQEVRDGDGRLVTGHGVKVAWIADGMDPNIAGFTRPDGSHVFIDYQNFSGDPAGTATGGGEAFGDASSIAAQDMPNGKPLLFDISSYVVPAHPLPTPCHVRIRGMAPGASLVGLNVFSDLGYTTTSNFVQAIEWAVSHDHVDVINESFGGAPFPDTTTDPISLADAAAIRAGVTVVVSSGDAGSAGTLGSPSTDLNVIAAGATNQWRIYAQTSDGAIPLTPHGGYINNNISAFSSGGFGQFKARTVDVVAPGDSGWALCSTNTAIYADCRDFNGNPTAFEAFGGTSESSPLTAGEAALVIQAYRSTHGGVNPSPALVKQIIMSTATDLGAPAEEQGAGLINSLAAVNAALSVADSHAKPKARGSQFLSSPSTALLTDVPNAGEARSFEITNSGATALELTPRLDTLGAPVATDTLNLTLNPAVDKTFVNSGGATRTYIKHTFKVPAGVQHLDAAIAFQIDLTSTASPLVLFALLDPSGNQAAYSIPQGSGNGYGHVDVVHPAAGTWTVLVWTRPTGVDGSYAGPVQFVWAAENYVSLGTVSPAHLTLAPGQSETIKAQFSMPSAAGDVGAAIRFNTSPSATSVSLPQIPVSLRTLVATGPTGGSFTGTLTGGNGRAFEGPVQTYAFDVPKGVKNMSLTLQDADSGYVLSGFLIDPNGMELSVETSLDPSGNLVYGLQLFHDNPQPGRWQFVLLQNYFSSGNQTTLPFTARIGFNVAHVATEGLPNSASVQLSASKAATATISLLNTGSVTQAFFADARLSALGVLSLPAVANPNCSVSTTLPGTCGQFILPPEVRTVAFVAQAALPINMDAFNDTGFFVGITGSPDIFAKQVAPGTVVAALSEPEIPWGTWDVIPSNVGPYGAAGAPTTPVIMAAFVVTQQFDGSVSADSGDLWADTTLGTATFKPLILGSGEAGTITLTIKPSASEVGQVISGFVYIDTFNPNVGTGDEMVRVPYSYTVIP
jgi:Subtilase family/Peptidase inhibitor I9